MNLKSIALKEFRLKVYVLQDCIYMTVTKETNYSDGDQTDVSQRLEKRRKNESRSVLSNSLRPHRLQSPWNSPGQNTGVGSLSLLQRIFSTQELNQNLLHCKRFLHQLNYQGSSGKRRWCIYKEISFFGGRGDGILPS